MRILVASDSFKGSMRSQDVIQAVAHAAARCGIGEVAGIALADGGEGFLDAVHEGVGGVHVPCLVTGPLGEVVSAGYVLLPGGIAVVEMAQCAGLTLVPPEKRNPLITTSLGLGELLSRALDDSRVQEIVVGIGGSATNDGGIGMLEALGIYALGRDGQPVARGGAHLEEIVMIDDSKAHPRLREVRMRVLSDVVNPLCGPHGATAIYGPQKGATPEMVITLERNLCYLATLLRDRPGLTGSNERGAGDRDADAGHLELPDRLGAGAAGGVGAALMAFCGAALEPGVDALLDLVNFESRLRDCDLVITGEGRTDEQSAFGKTVMGVARRAQRCGKPVVCLSGQVTSGAYALHEAGVSAMFSICRGPVSETVAMRDAFTLLSETAENVLRLFAVAPNALR